MIPEPTLTLEVAVKIPVTTAPVSAVSNFFDPLKYSSTLELANATIYCSPANACIFTPLLLLSNCI